MNVTTSAMFDATCSGFDTGLTGTIGVQILDSDGETNTARSTSGVVESSISDTVVYTKTLRAPTEPGSYWVVWDYNGTEAVEDLNVLSSPTADVDSAETVRRIVEYLNGE